MYSDYNLPQFKKILSCLNMNHCHIFSYLHWMIKNRGSSLEIIWQSIFVDNLQRTHFYSGKSNPRFFLNLLNIDISRHSSERCDQTLAALVWINITSRVVGGHGDGGAGRGSWSSNINNHQMAFLGHNNHLLYHWSSPRDSAGLSWRSCKLFWELRGL